MKTSTTEEQRLRNWLQTIYAVSLGQDGCNDVKNLVQLVDEINTMSRDGLTGGISPLDEI